jgi:hypothetical protein
VIWFRRHKHDWSDWAITDRGDVLWMRSNVVGWYAVQERHCHQCGKTQFEERVEYGGNTPAYCDRRSTLTKRTPRKDGVLA